MMAVYRGYVRAIAKKAIDAVFSAREVEDLVYLHAPEWIAALGGADEPLTTIQSSISLVSTESRLSASELT